MAGDNTVEEKYLIATSEQPIAAYHRWLEYLQNRRNYPKIQGMNGWSREIFR
jgi:hypothetical protein